ncbi:MAG: IS110 family transposase [Chloroflexi bacterium]|nr:IS110 family transposase [Chloroflexota bacterium]
MCPAPASAAPAWAKLPQVQPHAAGLDIGSCEIVACVPADRDPEPIRTFGTFTPDLQRLVRWLQGCRIETVAMESTGTYWVPIYELLEEAGIRPCLVNARHLKNVPGRKTDVSDAQWIQTLHSYGLLRASFIPAEDWRQVRTLWRQRQDLVRHRAAHIQHMQKALQGMNVQLTQVLADISGVTGLAIIRAIVAGERDSQVLARLRDKRCRHSQEEIAQALTGHYRPAEVFVLGQALGLYDTYTAQIAACDAELERQYQAMAPADDTPREPLGPRPNKNTHAKNAPAVDVRGACYRLTGVDLVAVPGLDDSTVQTILAEIGTDMTPWPTAKHFCSWLHLAPRNEITGGRVKRSRTAEGANRAGQALRLAAQSVMRADCAFGAHYRRLAPRIGREQALVATAHKIARTVYSLLKHRTPYVEMGADEYDRRFRDRTLRRVTRIAKDMGYRLVPDEQPQQTTEQPEVARAPSF